MSRPLRAAVGVLGGWIVLRTAMLWNGGPEAMVRAAGADPVTPPVPPLAAALDPVPAPDEPIPARRSAINARTTPTAPPSSPSERQAPAVATAVTTQDAVVSAEPESVAIPAFVTPESARPAVLPALPATSARNRFQLSGWALVRGAASPGGLVPAGTLGGSQIGMRGWFAPGPSGLVLTARVSSPLGSRFGSETSIGAGFRKGGVGVIVEERISLDAGGGARPSVTVFGGISDVRVRGKLRADGYAQAGIVGLNNRIGFADGAIRIEHPVLDKPVRLAVGAGAWGGAQPGLARLDTGPQIVARVPVAGGTMRIAGEWRFRIAGNADPGSGPVLSIGADF